MNQRMHRKTTNRVYEDLEELRKQADEIILDIWNQVEAYYKDKLPYERLRSCKTYGLIYYYRTGEKHLSPETDKALQRKIASEPTIQWTD